jgi:hypothetical protein
LKKSPIIVSFFRKRDVSVVVVFVSALVCSPSPGFFARGDTTIKDNVGNALFSFRLA